MRIFVTQEDIDKGERQKCTACPIALAASRALHQPNVLVDRFNVWVPGEERGRLMPDKAQLFVWKFDAGKRVRPFEFEL